MATEVYGLANDKQTGDKLFAGDVNLAADAFEQVAVGLADLFGAGCWAAGDFNGQPIPGNLAVDVSGGAAFAGGPAARKLVRRAAGVASGLAPNAANYVWLLHDGSFAVSAGDPPGGSVLLLVATTDSAEVTQINNLPAGRVNLVNVLAARVSETDRQGGYLAEKIVAGENVEVVVEPGEGGIEALVVSAQVPAEDSFQVKATDADPAPDFLAQKLVPGENVVLDMVEQPGGSLAVEISAQVPEPDAHDVLTSPEDTTPAFLRAKLSAGEGIDLQIVNPGENETVQITNTAPGEDVKDVLVSELDTTPGFISTKLLGGENVLLEILNPGENEQLQISATGIGEDTKEVKVSPEDLVPGFLAGKLAAGTGIGLDVLSPGENEQLRLTNTAPFLPVTIGHEEDIDLPAPGQTIFVVWAHGPGTAWETEFGTALDRRCQVFLEGVPVAGLVITAVDQTPDGDVTNGTVACWRIENTEVA